jgi:hypothetical protein
MSGFQDRRTSQSLAAMRLPHREAIPEKHVPNSPKDRYNLAQRAPAPKFQEMATICKHPRVRVVSRHEDTEFVECLECGEVFDSEEFRDMEIEETAEKEDVADE